MGLFDRLFKKPNTGKFEKYFAMLDGYVPVWSTYEGGVYEMELTRSCINAFATHCGKLQPHILGADLRKLQGVLETQPNPYQITNQFLRRTAAILETTNTCYIVPIEDNKGVICGYYPVMPSVTELVENNGVVYMRYTFANSQKAAVELSKVGIMTNMQFRSDLRGESNRALEPTMKLLDVQNKGIAAGIKNSAAYRFMATANNFAKGEDLAKERKRFTDLNLTGEDGGLLLLPNTYTNVQQLKNEMQIVDPKQMQVIETRVFDYFGCNENILQNKAVGDEWSAYYEGKIEPFAVQLSQAMTAMTFGREERARGNEIQWSANRLQYMTNADKLQVSSQMFDRGVMSLNDIMDIWNLPHIPDGDKRYIRKEYAEISKLGGDENGEQ